MFILSCESTVDMPFSYVSGRNIPVIFYSYTVDGADHQDDMQRDPQALPAFYEMLASGKMPTTGQLNAYQYREFFEEQLKKGDLLHITLGTGMTQSYQNAIAAAEELRAEYPDRKILIIDSLCSSSGYGLLVDTAADMRDAGKSMEEVKAWVMAHREKVHHQFFSTDLTYFRRSGRMSGTAAMLGTLLNICPIMHLNKRGSIVAYDKVRGKKNAVKTTVNTMEQHIVNGTNYDGKCFICHSNTPADADALKKAILERFPNIPEVPIFDIGTIIASHCGPGTAAVFFLGDERIDD